MPAAPAARAPAVAYATYVVGLLFYAELLRRLSGRLGEEIVRVVLRDLSRHVARDHAVVGEELRDALDRLERHDRVEARGANRLRRHVLRQPGLLRVDLRPARGVLARDLEQDRKSVV